MQNHLIVILIVIQGVNLVCKMEKS